MLPFLIETHLQDGPNSSWRVSLATGLALMHWRYIEPVGCYMHSRKGAFEEKNLWSAAWFGRLAAGPEWRLHDHFSLHVGASVGCKHNNDLHFGVFIEGSSVVGRNL
jgi:opacity protein-like surface antigen